MVFWKSQLQSNNTTCEKLKLPVDIFQNALEVLKSILNFFPKLQLFWESTSNECVKSSIGLDKSLIPKLNYFLK